MSEGENYKIIHKNKFRLPVTWASAIVSVSVAFVTAQTPFAFIALAVQLVK